MPNSEDGMPPEAVGVDEEDGPSLAFQLEEDINRKDQLFSFRKDPVPVPTKNFRPTEQQLLQEGKLGDSEFSARLQQVKFGTYRGAPACLIVIRANFMPKNRGFFRFRQATVEVEFEDVAPPVQEDANDDDDDDYDNEEDENCLLVCKLYPEIIRGHIANAAEKYNIKGYVEPVTGVGASTGWGVSRPKEGLHLIQGTLMGRPERRAKWVMNENEVSRGGIYEQPSFAVIVRHGEDSPFVMTLSMRAVTYGGLPVNGKGGVKIRFLGSKGKKGQQMSEKPLMNGLSGGSVQVGKQTWVGTTDTLSADLDLDTEVLEELTQMRSVLLGQQGPGASPSNMPVGL